MIAISFLLLLHVGFSVSQPTGSRKWQEINRQENCCKQKQDSFSSVVLSITVYQT